MVKTAIDDANAGHNVYIEARTVRAELRGTQRGTIEETVWVFGFVVDSDADKGKGGNVTARPSLAIETSPGNYHLWFLLTRPIPAAQAKPIGDAIRASSGADKDTGVVTQCYRVAGTPNFPSAAKRARGRNAVEATRIFEHTGRLWDPDELLATFSAPASASQGAQGPTASGDEATLPADLLDIIRHGCPPPNRSTLFHSVVAQLERRHWTIDAIVALLEKYPNGIAQKYIKRLRKEIERSYGKVAGAGTATPNIGIGPSCRDRRIRICARSERRTPRASRHTNYPPRRRPAPARGRGNRTRADRRRLADLRARRNPGRAGQRDHDRRQRTQDRNRATARSLS